MDQKKSKQPNRFQPLTSGLLFGAITAGSLVTGILELKARQVERQSGNFFEWPAITAKKQKSR
ncbi:MAG: hypothetical protein IIC33_05830 [Chloroflexi bacterium]|nr:hypothetical protein [Chloroflexota bacterium]